jgi:hypothetical protein
MQMQVRDLVQTIHDTSGRLVLVTAGAGTQALSWLLGVAGASRTLLEALVPYDWASFNDFLGQAPEQYVADETARLMAGRALTRARWLHQEEQLIGLACTATIATDRPKRGPHRAHIATWQEEQIATYSYFLDKGARDREREEEMVSRVLLNALSRAYGLSKELDLPREPRDRLEIETVNLKHGAQRLDREEIRFFSISEDGDLQQNTPSPELLLSGSFNPLHEGHLEMARAAQQETGKSAAFELSARNVDKPRLPPETVLSRICQFAGCWPVYASNAPTFLEKSRLYPGTTFLVGYDTAIRILHPRYYHDSAAEMREALAEIRTNRCDFLVAGRVDAQDRYHTAADLDVPDGLQEMFRPLPGFRHDISSTELRRSGRRGSR